MTTYYLVDDLNPTGYPQVVDELTGGVVTRQYTYGLQRISQNQEISSAWTPSFYGYDGGGSVRQLTNASGAVADTYGYDAYGNHWTVEGTTPNNMLYRGEEWDPDLSLVYKGKHAIRRNTGIGENGSLERALGAKMSDLRNFNEVLSRYRIDPESVEELTTGEAVSENEWSRTYCTESGTSVYESKFLDKAFTVKYEDIVARWRIWSPDERLEFAKAYRHKLSLSDEDRHVLSFLMENGDGRIDVCIASQVAAQIDPNKAFQFLCDRLCSESEEPKANFIQALATINLPASAPAIFEHFITLRKQVAGSGASAEVGEVIDLLHCCSALWKLEGSMSYRDELEKYVNDQRVVVRLVAQQLLQ